MVIESLINHNMTTAPLFGKNWKTVEWKVVHSLLNENYITLLHLERPKLDGVLDVLSAIGLKGKELFTITSTKS